MAFICPQCFGNGTLEIKVSMQLPSDSRSDEIALQIVECSQCGFKGIAVYEESRRGAMDSESWEHSGYWLNDTDLAPIVESILSCPEPFNMHCQCPAHRTFSKLDLLGRWEGLARIKEQRTFPLHLVM